MASTETVEVRDTPTYAYDHVTIHGPRISVTDAAITAAITQDEPDQTLGRRGQMPPPPPTALLVSSNSGRKSPPHSTLRILHKLLVWQPLRHCSCKGV